MAKQVNEKIEEINDEKVLDIEQNCTLIKTQVLIDIFSILHSCKVDGDAVDNIAYVKQLIKDALKPSEVK